MDSCISGIAGPSEDFYLSKYAHFRGWFIILQVALLATLLFLLTLSYATADFSLKDWRFVKSISVPDGLTEGDLVELVPDPEVFNGSAPGLVDLRIIQGIEQEVPYEVVLEKGSRERRSIRVSIRDLGFVPGQFTSFIADLGQEGLLHNELEVFTSSQNFQRDVIVEGSNDATTWAVLQEGTKIFDFTLKERDFTARDTRVRYPESTVRFLRVRVINDGEEPLDITGASVFSVTETLAEEVSYPAIISGRTEDSTERTSLIVFDLGNKGLPTNRLTIHTPQVNFYREVSLEGTGDAPRWSPIQRSGVLYSYDTPKFVGNKFTLSYPETTFRFLRLTINNEDNTPLPIEGVEVFGVPRKLIFQPDPGASYELYYGNADARPASYELERILPFLQTEDLPVGTLGPQMNNPAFTVEKTRLPFSERYAWLITVVVAVAAVAVATLLFGVVRKAKKVLPPPS